MKWTQFTPALLAAALLLLSACGTQEQTAKISDLTRQPASVETTQQDSETKKPEAENPKDTAPKVQKGPTKKEETENTQTPAQDEALLAAYDRILERSVEFSPAVTTSRPETERWACWRPATPAPAWAMPWRT